MRAASQRRRQRIVADLQAYKMERGCADCGYKSRPEALDFDHVRGTKVADMRTMLRRGREDAIWEEVAKCEVRCANCHRVRTADRRAETFHS
jgi:hypothetical protein